MNRWELKAADDCLHALFDLLADTTIPEADRLQVAREEICTLVFGLGYDSAPTFERVALKLKNAREGLRPSRVGAS